MTKAEHEKAGTSYYFQDSQPFDLHGLSCFLRDGDVIEVRQVFDVADFPQDVRKAADNPTVRAQVEKRKAS